MNSLVDVQFARGTGLGNKLFSWARSRVFARNHDLACLQPRWGMLRQGALFKGGVDYSRVVRKTFLFDNFRRAEGELRRPLIFKGAAVPTDLGDAPLPGVVHVFFGDAEYFRVLHPYADFIRSRIFESAKPKWLNYVDRVPLVDVCANIRLGRDFGVARSRQDFLTRGSLLTPLSWFRETIKLMRKISGRMLTVRIISDGTESQLRPLLNDLGGDVSFLNSPAAITDLLIAARSRLILGSGGSCFLHGPPFLVRFRSYQFPGNHFHGSSLMSRRSFLCLCSTRKILGIKILS